jgi:hypothetical protein
LNPSLVELIMFSCNPYCLKLALALCGSYNNICDCKRYVCMHDLGHTVEHIPGLPDLILFLANDELVVYDLDVG